MFKEVEDVSQTINEGAYISEHIYDLEVLLPIDDNNIQHSFHIVILLSVGLN